ncbi:MAG: recombination mediator RecR [Bifidobacteriaceae bacterium]|jgi:recombination protein RecR|nr:recombination mediator RecR [Bifidobacteriaceae bacterium]
MEKAIFNLIDQLETLPGIGPKAAQRIAYYILNTSKGKVSSLLESVAYAKDNIVFCKECGNYSTEEKCTICSDSSRDRSIICIVEQPKDVFAMENSGKYNGLYLVLGGQINPIENISAEDLRLNLLFQRIKDERFSEIIIATNLNLEGEVTANYIKDKLLSLENAKSCKLTRIASGLPAGSDIEFADQITLGRAIDYRTPI